MKLRPAIVNQRRRGQRGSAVIVVLILLFIMAAFVVANTITLNALRRQVKLTEQRQIQRLARSAPRSSPLSK